MYGEVCACCGESEISFLTIDHINGDGAAHRRSLGQTRGMSRSLMRWLLSEKRLDIQILCYNCNCSKRTSGVCAHEQRRRERLNVSMPQFPVTLHEPEMPEVYAKMEATEGL